VHVAQPAKLKAIANSQEKTDATDAWWLAYYLYEGRMPEAFVAEGALRELRISVREQRAVTSALADLKRRFRSLLAQGGEPLRKNAFETQVGQAEIEALLPRQSGMQGEALRRLWGRIKALRQERDEWAGLVDAQAQAFPEIGLLRSELAGVGPTLAPILWAELGSPKRFHSAKAYAKATGLTPGFRETGGKRQSLGMTRLGSPHVRWALTRAIIGCLRSRRGPGLAVKTWVETRWKRKPKKVTIVAAARKMAEAVWRLFEWGEAFDLRRVYGAAAG
jgi:transposase